MTEQEKTEKTKKFVDAANDFVVDVIAKEPKTKFKKLEYLFDFCKNLDAKSVPPKMQKMVSRLYDASKSAAEILQHHLVSSGCTTTHTFELNQRRGRLIAESHMIYKIDLGICWTCCDCERIFTEELPAFSRRVGIFPNEYQGWSCAECESYWYGRKNYGKKMPDYLKPRQVDLIRQKKVEDESN